MGPRDRERPNLTFDSGGGIVRLHAAAQEYVSFQVVVQAGVWQGSRLRPGGKWALLGTTMAPGFDCADYQGALARDLVRQYPDWAEWIDRLC